MIRDNLWAIDKVNLLRRLLVALADCEYADCEIEPDSGENRHFLTLRHPTVVGLRAHVYLQGQETGTLGLFYEYPYPVANMTETEENLPLARAVEHLALHFST